MKKTLLIITTAALLVMSGCTFGGDSPGDKQDEEALKDSRLYHPEKIETLIVPGCEELVAGLNEQYPETSEDEIYKTAADILFSDNRAEEANACCDKISDEEAKIDCKR